jgi:hypothetical protein
MMQAPGPFPVMQHVEVDMSSSETLADDILRGALAIGKFVGLEPRQTFHHLQAGDLPAVKEGRVWVSTKSRLRHFYNEARYQPPPKPIEPEPAEAAAASKPRKQRAKASA